jgi:hypothetical protein
MVCSAGICVGDLNALQMRMDAAGIFPASGNTPAFSQSRDFTLFLRVLSSVIVGVVKLIDGIAEFNITKQEESLVVTVMRPAVVGGFTGHVGKVYALSEHIAADWGFGGCDAEALAKDATVVGAAGTMPEEPAVAVFEAGI